MLGEEKIELGLGIHGEPGVKRMPMLSSDELVSHLLDGIFAARTLQAGERVALLLNNLGATTPMELAIVARRVLAGMESRGLAVERFYSGTLLTSLDTAGISVSVLRVDDERLQYLDAATLAPAWPNVSAQPLGPVSSRVVATSRAAKADFASVINTPFQRALSAACDAVADAQSLLTELDLATGDGDLGTNLSRAADALRSLAPQLPADVPEALKSIGLTLQRVLGGSSGPLFLARCFSVQRRR